MCVCWDISFRVHLYPVALVTTAPSDTAETQPQSYFCRFKFLQTSFLYAANTLRDSQWLPDGDSHWKRARRRQPCRIPMHLLSWIKQSNRQHETCGAATSSVYCSLFFGVRAERAIMTIQAAFLFRCLPAHRDSPAETGMYMCLVAGVSQHTTAC